MPGQLPHILVLGGTEEAYALAEALVGRRDVMVTSSLAGATPDPRLPVGPHRIGGFGGVDGLQAWLAAEEVALVLDASHPFATRITAQARAATGRLGIAYCRLERPGWTPGPGDDWRFVADLEAGLQALIRRAQRVFAAVGGRALDRLGAAPLRFVVRAVERPAAVPANVTFVTARGPFDVVEERALLLAHGVDALLCRNSGGSGSQAKLEAARGLGLPVVMIERPAPAPPGSVPDVPAALATIDQLFRGRSTWV